MTCKPISPFFIQNTDRPTRNIWRFDINERAFPLVPPNKSTWKFENWNYPFCFFSKDVVVNLNRIQIFFKWWTISKYFSNWKIQQFRDPIPVNLSKEENIRSNPTPNTKWISRAVKYVLHDDPLEFGRLRHKSSLLPGPDLLLALFINMIFQRIFWVCIFVWIWFFCRFSFSDFIKTDWKCTEHDFRYRYLISWSFFDQIQKILRKLYSFFKYIGRNNFFL